MTDREKVIKKAERIICSTVDRDMIDSFCEDVIDLLKEREPKRMWLCNGKLCCPQCGTVCKSYYHYCNECGQAVKWDDR